jgi:flagellar motor switch protein FliN/FliY
MNDETDNENKDQDGMDDWAAAMAEQGVEESTEEAAPQEAYESAQFQDLQEEPGGSNMEENLDTILEIPVTISMEIGRTQINIRNLLQLNQGSVVELDRLAGEPMDVMVNGTLIAHGEVVVVNEKFGIRLTDVISPSERVKKLK